MGQTIPVSLHGTGRRGLSAASAGLRAASSLCYDRGQQQAKPAISSGQYLLAPDQAVPWAGGQGPVFVIGPRTLLPDPLGWKDDRRRVVEPRARALKRAIAGLSSLHEKESA